MNCLKMDKLIVLKGKLVNKVCLHSSDLLSCTLNNKKGILKMKKIILTVAAAGLLSACSLMGPSHSVKGEVVDASMNTVTIETADSKIYSFSTMDSDKTELNGLLLGKKIEVQFSGNYQDGMPAKKLSDIAK